ncbi:MAG: hypothetical protein HYU66_13060, partial [Armatimonadetes bacterium]|nr:hypothetical protein [Armatimonadota bacterium]
MSIEARIPIEDGAELAALVGPADEHLQILRRAVQPVQLTATRDGLMVNGDADAVDAVRRLVAELLTLQRGGTPLAEAHFEYAARRFRDGNLEALA